MKRRRGFRLLICCYFILPSLLASQLPCFPFFLTSVIPCILASFLPSLHPCTMSNHYVLLCSSKPLNNDSFIPSFILQESYETYRGLKKVADADTIMTADETTRINAAEEHIDDIRSLITSIHTNSSTSTSSGGRLARGSAVNRQKRQKQKLYYQLCIKASYDILKQLVLDYEAMYISNNNNKKEASTQSFN